MRHDIRFLRRGNEVRLSEFSPTLTLLDYLRLQERAVGTKEGCAEGDCGACTVVVRRAVDGVVTYEPRNACILLMGQVDGCEVITVEDLRGRHSCIRSSRRWSIITARNAASARPAS